MQTTDDTYIDLQIYSLEQTSSRKRATASFHQTSSQILVSDTTNYKLAIMRFVINTESLPVFIPQLQAKEKSKTVYSFTFEYNGQSYQQYMNFEPQILNSADSSEYYYVLTYQWLIYLVNKCIKSGIDGLNSVVQLPTVSYPEMVMDLSTNICKLKINSAYYGYNETNKINIYMNAHMYSLFTSLPNCIVNKDTNGMDVQLNNLISSDPNTLTQEYDTTGLWNPISSVIFTTNMIPVKSTNAPPVQIYKDGISTSSASFNFMNIITDFIGNDLNFTKNGFMMYESQNNRYIALKDRQQIKDLDVHVYWIDKLTGSLHPVYISPGSFSSIKILLTKEI